MKKILIALLAIFLFAGCSNKSTSSVTKENKATINSQENSEPIKKDAKSLAVKAMEKMAKSDNFSAKMTNAGEGDENVVTNLKFDIKNGKLEMKINIGNGIEMEYFADTEYMYINTEGMKIKMPVENLFSSYSDLLTFNVYKDIEIKDGKVEDNGLDYIVSYTIPASEIVKVLNTIGGSTGNETSAISEDFIKSADISITIDKDMNIKSVETNSKAQYDDATRETKTIIEYFDYNSTKVDFPSDLDEYQNFTIEG